MIYLERKMAKIKLPFWLYPSHWGLNGQEKQIAMINYSYNGYDAEFKILELMYSNNKQLLEHKQNELMVKYGLRDEHIFKLTANDIEFKYASITKDTYDLKKLEIELQYNFITKQEYDKNIIEFIKDDNKKYVAALNYSLQYQEITQSEFDKEMKTINKEPWFEFNVEYNQDNSEMILTFDYNEYFWKKLRDDGHPGTNENEIIDNFIKDWGRKLATEDYSGDYDTKLTEINDEMNRMNGTSDTGFKIYK